MLSEQVNAGTYVDIDLEAVGATGQHQIEPIVSESRPLGRLMAVELNRNTWATQTPRNLYLEQLLKLPPVVTSFNCQPSL